MQQEVVKLWNKDHDLHGYDFILLPGGFSHGDYLRSGAIARFSLIMQEVKTRRTVWKTKPDHVQV